MKPVLIINSGSSSIKFTLYDMEHELPLVSGKLERLGESDCFVTFNKHVNGEMEKTSQPLSVKDHTAGLKQIIEYLERTGPLPNMQSLHAIGHRVVHGGEAFQTPALISENVIHSIQEMIPLAPLHNPINLDGIMVTHQLCPQVPQVAVFDTAFFRTLLPHTYRYAIPDELYTKHQIRRYGFHGTSHQYVAARAASELSQPLESLRLITLHLGNGASAAAIRNGKCIDTSMGMTPLEGLIMGTRCGDIDPAVHFYLARNLDMSTDNIETLLNHNSGMKGLCGHTDMREIHRLANAGNDQARLAIEMYCYRISKYIGAYYIALGGLDALVFTAGIGENDSLVRQLVCDRLAPLDIFIDIDLNQSVTQETFINEKNSKVKILVIPTNEELEIARQTMATINTS